MTESIGVFEAVIASLASSGLLIQLLSWWSKRAKEKEKLDQDGILAQARVRELSDRAVADLIERGVLIGRADAERLVHELDEMREEIRTLVRELGQAEERIKVLEEHVSLRERERDRAVNRVTELEEEVRVVRRQLHELRAV